MAVRIESQAEPIPGYKLLERLGGGGFGEVWKAIAPGGLHKAIKFVYGDLKDIGEEGGARAEQELKALSRVKTVRHPYILSLERYDIIDGQLIIVMELADRNLWDRFRECRHQNLPGIPREELLRYMEETAEALDLMNLQYQLQHLDIKPQNLFLVHNHAKVADFGLVKDLEGVMASLTGGVTPVYAAPETFDGWVSRFSDQYSLGIVYQELLTGERPFASTNIRQLIKMHLEAPPNLNSLPAFDREAIARALSKNPDDRYPTCQDFVRVLRGNGEISILRPAPSRQESSPPLSAPQSVNGPVTASGRIDSRLQEETGYSQPAGDTGENPEEPGLEQTRWIHLDKEGERRSDFVTPAPGVPQEMQGDGVLFPGLVVGLGSLGLAVLKRLRESIHKQCGSRDQLASLRLLYLDTDPDTSRLAAQGHPGAALVPNEVLQAKLNRPSHYLRAHEGRTRIDAWFNPKMLYRIPRTPATTGLRALGRLAFLDNYRLIARRLQTELETCTRPETLAAVAKQTGLGLRTNQPRVYVVTGLAGGTGSGMFLDVAYVVRKLLKQFGYSRPEIIGVFLLPAVDRHPSRTLALGNAFAALTELNHFSAPGTTFTAHYDEREKPVQDSDAPYGRCFMLPLPQGNDERPLRELMGMTADFLFRDLVTPLGRVIDERRAERPLAARTRELICQTFGMYRISWPRRALLQQVGRRLCQQLVQRWMTKETAPLRSAVKELVTAQWAQEEMGGEQLMGHLQKACAETLGEATDTLLAGITAGLAQLDTPGTCPVPAVVQRMMARVDQVLGQPDSSVGNSKGQLADPLTTAAEHLTQEWGGRLAGFAARLIEEPQFRLAGAEEAARQLMHVIEQALQHYEPLCKELTARTNDARTRLLTLLGTIPMNGAGTGRAAATVSTLVELLRVYPKWRHQSLVLQRLANVYVSLRGRLSDQLREINECRTRLNQLHTSFAAAEREAAAAQDVSTSRTLFPAGCRTLDDAVQYLMADDPTAEMQDLDGKIQTQLQDQFAGLASVCLGSSNLLKNLELAMQRQAEYFASARLSGANLAEMYVAHHESQDDAQAELAMLFAEAAPALAGQRLTPESELRLAAAPPGPTSERFRELGKEAMPNVEWIDSAGADDIVFYREVPQFLLTDLEQIGPLGFEAYRQMASAEHFTPHSRIDINKWRAATAG